MAKVSLIPRINSIYCEKEELFPQFFIAYLKMIDVKFSKLFNLWNAILTFYYDAIKFAIICVSVLFSDIRLKSSISWSDDERLNNWAFWGKRKMKC